MGRLVRVGSYYFPSRPQTGEVATLYPFRICYRKYPGRSRRLMTPSMLAHLKYKVFYLYNIIPLLRLPSAVRGKKVRRTVLLIVHDPIVGEVATLYPFRICCTNTRDGRGV